MNVNLVLGFIFIHVLFLQALSVIIKSVHNAFFYRIVISKETLNLIQQVFKYRQYRGMAGDATNLSDLDQDKYDADEQVKIICLGDSAVGKSK